jgi:hypothetical protein
MSKQSVLKVMNPLLFIAWATQAVTGLLAKGVTIPLHISGFSGVLIKPGTMSFETFGLVHPRVGYAVVVLGLIHLMLNWSWVKTAVFGVKPKRPAKKAS